ncbi:VOC family protein [Novosphingobium sp. Leaf2]|uniref:VOC family protein n=1 Tax=Novosphingobium sp. Leaf2 TaxID=1735670 RepID=UPI0006F94D5B|nr:VOC family protein [Novosphingobium sp. Leaf2]KQM21549.1 lactoylglutathione lyase [Novosphingobium sp. Leaf2]
MAKMIFVNLPVTDVAKATAFYEAVGFVKNEAFSNAQVSAMNWSDTIHVMLMDHAFFSVITPKTIVDPRTHTSAVFALSLDDRAQVDAITQAAIDAGGREAHEAEDMGYMYSRAFEDLDGHGWGPFHMDMNAAPPASDGDAA